MPLPVVAIVGRPNVGKSTLFNRLVGKRMAIVSDIPGTTRDRLTARLSWDGSRLLLVDTGGLVLETEDQVWQKVREQVETALEEAALLVLVVDASTGLHPADQAVADLLRRRGKPVVVAANKCEGEGRRLVAAQFYRLGLGDPVPVSALHNQGMGELMERVLGLLPPAEGDEEGEEALRLAIVGRPNVGKSSLLNAIVGEERAIVHEAPGTTRDALDTPFVYRGQRAVLIDTAGIRRRGRVQPGVEKYSVLRALQAIERSTVSALVLDAMEMVTAQDAHIAGYITDEAYRGLVIVVNKWDLARQEGATREKALQVVRGGLHWVPYAPVCFTCALTGEGVPDLLESALRVARERGKQVDNREVARVVMSAVVEHPPPGRLEVYRAFQSGVNPPTFTFVVNDPRAVHFSYHRYLENRLRRAFGFEGNPLRLVFQKGRRRRER